MGNASLNAVGERLATVADVACPGGAPVVSSAVRRVTFDKSASKPPPRSPQKAAAGEQGKDDGKGAGTEDKDAEAAKAEPESRVRRMKTAFKDAVGLEQSFDGIEDLCSIARSKLEAARDRVLGYSMEVLEDGSDLFGGQDHVFAFKTEMTTEEFEELGHQMGPLSRVLTASRVAKALDRIRATEFAANDYHPPHTLPWNLKKAPRLKDGINLTPLREVGRATRDRWFKSGLAEILDGSLGTIVLAGGDGDRIPSFNPAHKEFRDSPCPAMLNVGLLSTKSVFQLLAERLHRIENLATRRFHTYIEVKATVDNQFAKRRKWVSDSGKPQYPPTPKIPMYIMVNPSNRAVVERFFEERDYFNRGEENVLFFEQDCWPLVSKTGKFLMKDKKHLLLKPAGSGNVFEALQLGGIVMDIKARDIKHLYITNCDNLLAKMGDPTFVGHCLEMGTTFGIKSIERQAAEEDVGLLTHFSREVIVDDHEEGDKDVMEKTSPSVLEHYEIDKVRRRQSGDRRFVFFAGNLSQYWCTVELALATKLGVVHALPARASHFSTSQKKVIKPDEGAMNAMRLECLVSDVAEHLESLAALHVDRDGEYAPMRNPLEAAVAVSLLGLHHQSWITSGGGRFAKAAQVSVNHDGRCEISPLVSYEGEDIAQNWCLALTSTSSTVRLPLLVMSGAEGPTVDMPAPLPTGSDKKHLKFTPYASITLEDIAPGPSPNPDWFSQQNKECLERAQHWEELPDTPRWLREQEQNWQETHLRKMKDLERQKRKANSFFNGAGGKNKKNQVEVEDTAKRRQAERTLPVRPESEGPPEDVRYGCARYKKSGSPMTSVRTGRRHSVVSEDSDVDG